MTYILKKCSKCGKEFDMWDLQENFSIHKQIGYGSLYDGEYLKLDLCCKCMDELIDACKVSPIQDT